MLNKTSLLLFIMTVSPFTFAGEAEELISKTRIGFRTKVDSYLRVNKLNRPYALVATKKDRRGINGCAIHRGTMSTRRCRVLSEKIRVKSLSVDEGNNLIFNNGNLEVNCGYLKDTWLGNRVVLNDKCRLVDYEEVVQEDDGLDIRKVKYAITKFVVTE